MANTFCPNCGAEFVAGMNFCRRCGAAVVVSPDPSEQPTAILNQTPSSPATQRFDPRPTGAAYGAAPPSAPPGPAAPFIVASEVPAATPRSGSMRGLIIVGIIIVVLLGIGSVVGVMKTVFRARSQSRSSVSKQLIGKSLVYPGAQTILDVTSEEGTGVLQLKTTDGIDKVADWYEAKLKPTKTVRVGPTVVMKSDTVTATIVSDGSNTNILIKQAP
jgi:hypothetical protein